MVPEPAEGLAPQPPKDRRRAPDNEPRGRGVWAPVTLDRSSLLSFYYCSAYALHDGADGHGALRAEGDIGDIGGCAP